MKRLIATCIAAAVWSGAALAQERTIEDTITNQLQAFNDRDVDAAWQYASPMIKGMFQTPENFGRMVENGYPMVWDNSDVRFLEPRQDGPFFYQRVMMRDENGTLHIIEYKMIRAGESWLIDGVQLMPPAVGA